MARPTFFPGFSGLGQKMFSWRSGYASASEDAAKQMRSAALNGSYDVRNCRVHYRNIYLTVSDPVEHCCTGMQLVLDPGNIRAWNFSVV
jgi:hypothetical protein